jgi:hypothetical protein
MRIARPLLLVSTPLGVALGLREAWRMRPALALLMALLLVVVGVCFAVTWRVWRRERAAPAAAVRPVPDRPPS